MQPLIIFDNISHKYGTYHVLEDVSFEIEKGSITTLIGPNGAGKTTIARLLLNLESPFKGKISNNFQRYSYVPQKLAVNRDLPLKVKNFVKLLCQNYVIDDMAKILLNFANIEVLENEQITNLSGGQLQRLMISTAILNNPELLVLDEPTQNLDIDGQEEFYSILDEIKRLKLITIFIISHDLFTVMKKSDQVLCLNHHLCCRGRPTHTVVKGYKNIGIYSHSHDHIHE